MSSTPTTVVILAAGRGERFRAAGGLTDKLEAPIKTSTGTQTVLQRVIAAAQASGLPWHVVTCQDTSHCPVQGMGTSIATGVQATADAAGWLILPGDLPLIQTSSLKAVAQALTEHPIVVPFVQGQTGHPVGFGRMFRDQLIALSGDQGARHLLRSHPPYQLPLNDIGCTLDVDTPEVLAQATKQLDFH